MTVTYAPTFISMAQDVEDVFRNISLVYSRTWLSVLCYMGHLSVWDRFSWYGETSFPFSQALATWDSLDGPLSVPLIQVRLHLDGLTCLQTVQTEI